MAHIPTMSVTLKKICLALSIFAVFFATLEAIQRWRHPQKGFTYSFNSMGCRGPEFSPHKAAGITRIVFIGGSTTFGTPLPADQSFPYLAGQMLQEKRPGKTFETINGGRPFKTSYWEVERLRESLAWGPDMVIVMSGYNDAALVHSRLAKIADRGDILITPWYIRCDRLLMSISVFYTTLREKISLTLHGNPEFAYTPPTDPERERREKKSEWFRHYPSHYRKNLEEMIRLARSRNVQLIFLNAPLSVQRRMQHPLYERAYLTLMQEMQRTAAQYAIPVIDLNPLFPPERQRELITHDGLHLTVLGNAAIAGAVTDFLMQRGLSRAQ